jgi:hypothetical protein
MSAVYARGSASRQRMELTSPAITQMRFVERVHIDLGWTACYTA